MTTATIYPNGQTEIPYWLPRTGADAVSFIKQAAPPLAWLNRGILYELLDGILYYNGSPVVTGDVPVLDGVTFDPAGANPGGANTLWMNTAGHLVKGDNDLENWDPSTYYVSPGIANGTLADGATGFINNPLSTLAEAVSLWTSAGAMFVIQNDDSAEPAVTLPAQSAIVGQSGLSFRSTIGDLTIAGPSWTGLSPYGFNVCSLSCVRTQGLIDYQDAAMVGGGPPLLLLSSASIIGGIQTNGVCQSYMIIKDSIVHGTVAIRNTNANIESCQFGILGLDPGDVTIFHDEVIDMAVIIGNSVESASGTIVVNADSLTNVLRVSLVGYMNFTGVTIASVAAPGGLVLTVDDIPAGIVWGPGAQANTTLVFAKQADLVGYTPAIPGDWAIPPTEVASALDALAASGSGDVVGPAGATDEALARYDGVTGKLIQNSVVLVSDAGAMSGVSTLNGSAIPATIGDVVGPAGATDEALARYDGATGKLVQNSVVLVSDAGDITGVATINGAAPGDVVGPAGATDMAIARYNGVTGKALNDSLVTVDNLGQIVGATLSTTLSTINVTAAGGASLDTLLDQAVTIGSTPTFFFPAFTQGASFGSPYIMGQFSTTIGAGVTLLTSALVPVGGAARFTVQVTSKESTTPGFGTYIFEAVAYNTAGVLTIIAGNFALSSETGLGFANLFSFVDDGGNSLGFYVTTATIPVQTIAGMGTVTSLA